MRINNNVMALNAHRQLGINQAGAAKSMEKLSSGLRINRAGDDAAGLAISEKMRGQIRGLKQASRNAQDGISLIQTAEGALNETHSILQRMRELAVQSANDTNVKVDRGEIQKEINALTSELNRIGNTTEFNTQKLLKGGGTETELKVDTATAGAGLGKVAGSSANENFNMSIGNSSTAGAARVWGNTIAGDYASAGTNGQSATFSFQGTTVTVAFAADGVETSYGGATETTQTVTFAQNGDATDLAAAVATAFGNIKSAGGDDSALRDFAFSNTEAVLDITAQTKGAQYNSDSVTFGDGGSGMTAVATAGTLGADEVRGEYSFTIDKAFEAVGTTITISGQAFVAGTDFEVSDNAGEQAIGLAAAINSNTALNARFDALVDGDKITLREKTDAATGTDLTVGTLANNTAVRGEFSVKIDEPVAVGGKYEVDGVSIEVTDNASHAGLANGTAVLYDAAANGQAAKLRTAIQANTELRDKYDVEVSNTTLTLTQKAGQESINGPEANTNTSAKDGFEANFQVGANSAQSMTVAIDDMRSQALGISVTKEGDTKEAANGKIATFTKTQDVTDGTTNKGVEYALDVSTHDKATNAVSVIDDAMEKVSAERSKMGAYQNRLEHTISNLGTSAENLQAAESRIRDLDMAEEIMSFTKNNILQQAATAMLAQANMAPQSVLQLLG